MARLGANRWGKSQVRVSKVHRAEDGDDFSDVTVQILLEGQVERAHTGGDNRAVLPTDTMRNTVYALAQDHLSRDLELFGETLCRHFLGRPEVERATVVLRERIWEGAGRNNFLGGRSETRTARLVRGDGEDGTWAGLEGMVVLKTRGSAFKGFPRDQFTTLHEVEDRLLATTINAEWRYQPLPADTSAVWAAVRQILVDRFFGDWSASVQHQGWMMAVAVLEAVPELAEITLRLPNQHHLPFDLGRFGLPDHGVVFHPVSEPYGDIALTVHR